MSPLQVAYRRFLACCYASAASINALHLLGMIHLSAPVEPWEAGWDKWIVAMAAGQGISAVGLWRLYRWGTPVFLVVAFGQLIVYGTVVALFGVTSHPKEVAVIAFHVVTLAGFIGLRRSGPVVE